MGHLRFKVGFLALFCCLLQLASAQLQLGFYNATCPSAESIVRQVVQRRFTRDRSVPAALLRMYFHDCFVQGCDASILIDPTRTKQSEKNAGPNFSVRGFDIIDEAKTNLEAACPSTVSCADIIALATRDAVALAGGPAYFIPTGRRDGTISDPNLVNLPGPQFTVSEALQLFLSKGFTLTDMVTLLGGHTVGVAHCSLFQDRLSNFQGTGKPDRTMDRGFAAQLLRLCGTLSRPTKGDPTTFLDQNTSFIVDNQFYNMVQARKGVLQIDQELLFDASSARVVKRYASNNSLFLKSFASALIKLGNVEVLVGTAGQIRKNCRVFNPTKA